MTGKTNQDSAPITNEESKYLALAARSSAALRAYLNAPRGEGADALEAYDAEMGAIDEAYDALLDADYEGVIAHLLAASEVA